MTAKRIVTPERHIGLSTDTKPTHQRAGATFYEYDTDLMKITYDDGTTWVKKEDRTNADSWMFGTPTLSSANNGKARWIRGTTSPLDQKSATGWLANLYGGVQTGDDWARVNIPVNELPVPAFATAKWSYYMSATETMGVNIVIWVHDPDDFDNRAEITQLGGVAGLEKTAGWNAHEFDSTDAGMFYYGEITGTPDTTPTAGTQYTWAQFQADSIFSTYTIYRITIEYGWEASGTFDDAYVADIKLNGQLIPLTPMGGKHKKNVLTTKTLVGGANSAFDVVSNSVDAGTDWDFDFGGTGKITKAILDIGTTALTAEYSLHLFSTPPTCNLHDNVANTSPVTADVPYFVGAIEFSALRDYGTTGHSYSVATISTPGNLALPFDTPILYGVLIAVDAHTPGNVLGSIHLFADMED
uniref:Uncharacterized protein n=2 Tax=viral metagenome TaxID=1070528 RepID=A0A6M3IG19_9ZZZZ